MPCIERGDGTLGPTDLDTRYVLEDVPFGLVPTERLGRLVGAPAVLHESGINLLSAIYGRDFRPRTTSCLRSVSRAFRLPRCERSAARAGAAAPWWPDMTAVVIVGAGAAGRATARALAEAGVASTVLDRSPERLETLRTELAGEERRLIACRRGAVFHAEAAWFWLWNDEGVERLAWTQLVLATGASDAFAPDPGDGTWMQVGSVPDNRLASRRSECRASTSLEFEPAWIWPDGGAPPDDFVICPCNAVSAGEARQAVRARRRHASSSRAVLGRGRRRVPRPAMPARVSKDDQRGNGSRSRRDPDAAQPNSPPSRCRFVISRRLRRNGRPPCRSCGMRAGFEQRAHGCARHWGRHPWLRRRFLPRATRAEGPGARA